MKITNGLHVDLVVEESDYFVVQPDHGEKLKIILTNRKRRPLNLKGITRKQAYSLLSQLQRTLMLMDAVRLEETLTVAVDNGEGIEHEKLLDGQD